MKGTYIFLFIVFASLTSFAETSERIQTPTQRRHHDSMQALQESFIDLIFGFSFDRKRPMPDYTYTFTKNRFLNFLENTTFDYGNRNFLERVSNLYNDIEETLKIEITDEEKQIFASHLLNQALPEYIFGNHQCSVYLLN